MLYKIDINEIEKRIYKIHKNNLIISNFISNDDYADFHCNICGHNWFSIVKSVATSGTGCPKCGFKKFSDLCRFKIEDVKIFIESKNCKLISTEYVNNRKKLEIQFECGHIGFMSFYVFKRGERCSCTAKQRMKETIGNKTKPKILEELNSVNFKFISFSDEIVGWGSDVTYECSYGHIETRDIRTFMRRKTCKECTKIKQSLNQTGSNGSNWQGGLTELKSYLNKYIKDWKKESIKNSNYKCVISGKRFDDVHHLQSFNLLLKEAIQELNLELKDTVGEYLEEELFLLINKIKEVHNRYPLGVCLTKSWHKRFHKEYGIGDTTPQQWYEFLNRVNLGEITI